MEIEIIDQVCRGIFDELNKKKINVIKTDVDYFWNIDISDALNFDEEIPKICIESIKDDYEALLEISNGRRNVNILDLDRIANIIRVIAYEIENSQTYIL